MTPLARSILATATAFLTAYAVLEAANASDIEKGRQLAERLCATCHMGQGQGEKTSPSEIPGFAAVANRPDQTIEGIIAWLRSIPPMMPNHRLSQDEMAALAEFIMSLKTVPP